MANWCTNKIFYLKGILRFWLDKGVDGFRIDALAHLFEVNDTSLDEPKNPDGAGVDPVGFRLINYIIWC